MAKSEGKDPPRDERFTEEELKVVRSAGLFDTYLGRGWFRNFIIYGIPAVSALLIAAGIFSSLVEVSETLLLYSQPRWIPENATGVRLAIMDRDGEYVPITDLEMTLHDRAGSRNEVLFDGVAHGTKAASLYVVPPAWPKGGYELEVHVQTTRRTKKAILPVVLDPGYGGERAKVTRELRTWRQRFGSENFMQEGSELRVDLVPEGGQVASSLPNILYVRTTKAGGEPVSARVGLTLEEGYVSGKLPGEVITDSLGLASVLVYPTFNVLVMGVAALASEAEPPAEPPAEAEPAPLPAPPEPRPSLGRIILPIGPQGIRLRPLVPNPQVGQAAKLRVYSVGSDRVMFTDLYHNGIWVKAAGTTVDGQSSEILAPITRVEGLHVVQAYSSPVPAIYQKLPGQPLELMSCSMSAAHIWVKGEGESDLDSLVRIASVLERMGVDHHYVAHLTPERLEAGGFNAGQAIAFLLARLDGAVYPPDVSASSRADDKRTASALQVNIRRLVVIAFSLVGLIVIFAFGFLTFETWRSAKAGKAGAGDPGAESPISSQDPGWLRKQIFQMSMIIAVVVGTFALLAVLVMYLRWHIG